MSNAFTLYVAPLLVLFLGRIALDAVYFQCVIPDVLPDTVRAISGHSAASDCLGEVMATPSSCSHRMSAALAARRGHICSGAGPGQKRGQADARRADGGRS